MRILKNSSSKKSDFFNVFGWAFYLACSWTWCIGMFLPVILIRDYGICGWLIFAIPNIVGATTLAYVLKKSDTSKELVKKHKFACIVFSVVTVLFQFYFIGWISNLLPKTFIVVSFAVLLLVYLLCSIVDATQRFTAFIVWILSLILFILILNIVPIENIDLYKSGVLTNTSNALLYLTPVCFFGFSLCPYLDLTFHKARQSNTLINSKIAFTIGFCFLFLIMILFTFFYARPMANIIEGTSYFLKDQKQLPKIYIYIVVFHLLIQTGFTIILHLRTIIPTTKEINKTTLLLVISSIFIYLLPLIFNVHYTFLGFSINEIIYRSFMAFYGLIAPAYVFLLMIPKKEKSIPLNNKNLLLWALVILFALPFYAIAFLGVKWNLEIYGLIGLCIVLASRELISYKNINS